MSKRSPDPANDPLFSDDVLPGWLVCRHRVDACIVCMTDERLFAACEQAERRRQIKEERQASSIAERFDLGGEA